MGSKLAGIPLPKSLTREKKKKTMESAIEWLRVAEPEDLDHIGNRGLEALTNLAGVPMPGVSPADKAKALDDALEWLRKNEPDVGKVDKPTLDAVAKLAGVPVPKKLTAEGKEKVLNDSLDWLRRKDVVPEEVDEPTLKAVTMLAGVP